MTIQDLRKCKYKTIKAFADAGNMTMYQAHNWLHARYGLWYIEAPENAHILPLFGVSLEEYRQAWYETDAEEKARWREKHPPLTPEQKAAWETELRAYVDEAWAKMTDAQKRRVHEDAVRLGFVQRERSPIEMMIDRACGLE